MEDDRKLNKKLIKSKIVYFIGAGFSKILGYPIMSEFIDKYLIKNLPIKSEIIIKAIKDATGSSDLEIILSVLEKMVDTKYAFNLEDYIDTIYKVRKGAEYSGVKPGASLKNYNSEIIFNLKSTISLIKKKIFQTYRPKVNLNYDNLDYFFNNIIDFNDINSGKKILIPIFTTNYDNVIEEYLKSKKIKINIINGFNKDNIFNIKELEVSRFKNNINIYLFHLHGSIFFYEDKEFKCIKNLEMSSYLEDGNYFNKIIYPTTDKTPKDEPFFSYYDYLSRCLDNAYYVYFIGYSFRDFESLVRIKSSMIYNKKLKIIIIDNRSDNLKKKIFNNNNRVLSHHCHFNRIDDLKKLSSKLSKMDL